MLFCKVQYDCNICPVSTQSFQSNKIHLSHIPRVYVSLHNTYKCKGRESLLFEINVNHVSLKAVVNSPSQGPRAHSSH